MLKTILTITGKPGLFKIITQGKNSLIVEDLTSKRRMPVLQRDRLVSLGDIAMYTMTEEKPLGEVLDLVYANTEGKAIDIKALVADKGLKSYFEQVLPDFDQDRVYDSDIKKLLQWYNILIASGMTKFTEDSQEKSQEETSSTEA